MNKNKRSLIAMNRNLFVALAVILGLAVSGVVAWQVSATAGSGDNSTRSITSDQDAASPNKLADNSTRNLQQDENRGIYRGVQTAVRFDISPPLRSIKAVGGQPENERTDMDDRPTGFEQPVGAYQQDKAVQTITSEGASEMPTPSVSFDSGISCACSPPDPNGEVGPNHYVAMGNLQY